MGTDPLHELTAAYVLDALDPADEAAYEEHLAHCAACQEEVALLSGTATALALAAGPADPPDALRGRILDAARAERPNVVPLRPRWSAPLAAAAAIAACAVVGLGVWNISLHHRLDRTESALRGVPLHGAAGSVVLGVNGRAALVVTDLAAAPKGRTYEAWVIDGTSAASAGLFHGGEKTVVVQLGRRVRHGSVVGVTVEPAGGSAQPTTQPFITSAAI
ncbi:MAG TPA: anti-sigma factor [Gaiellaceae bacterium]|nr:anti-sigma factor [Gaiellaceae bacterium]